MRWLSWLGVVVVCLAVAGALGFYKYNEIQAAIQRGQSFPEPAEAVEVYVVQQEARRPTLAVTGEVVATQSAQLTSELKGRIVAVGFEPGARVRGGQILLQLDISQEQAQLAEARADQQIARLALDRAQRLVKRGAGSVEARDQARAQFDAARARVDALSALIDKKTLRAPFDAVTSLHELEVGQFLEAGANITKLVGVSEDIWIDFALPQDNARIQLGSPVEIVTDELVDPVPAVIIARDAAVNVRSRNLRLRAQLPAEQADLLPGMLVTVVVPLGETRMATVVPATAVRRDAAGAAVYVLTEVVEDGQAKTRAERRPVVTGDPPAGGSASELVEIVKGVTVGEQIAAIGAFKLRHGSLVMPSEPNVAAQERVVGR